MTPLVFPPIATPLSRAMPELRAKGFCVLNREMPREIIEAMDLELAADFAATPFGQGDFYGVRTKRFGRLFARSLTAQSVAENIWMRQIADTVLLPFCNSIQINVAQGIEVHPGALAQMPHRDQDMWPAPKGEIEYLLNIMWPLTPFTLENGATRFWPGSHGAAALEDPPTGDGEAAICEPGDAIVFLGSTLHAAGPNRTSQPRRGVIIGYSLGWLKPYENLWLAYPPAVARTFDPRLQALVGYEQHRPNLGNVDGQCPSLQLSDHPPDHPGAIDALTPDQTEMVRLHADIERARAEPCDP